MTLLVLGPRLGLFLGSGYSGVLGRSDLRALPTRTARVRARFTANSSQMA